MGQTKTVATLDITEPRIRGVFHLYRLLQSKNCQHTNRLTWSDRGLNQLRSLIASLHLRVSHSSCDHEEQPACRYENPSYRARPYPFILSSHYFLDLHLSIPHSDTGNLKIPIACYCAHLHDVGRSSSSNSEWNQMSLDTWHRRGRILWMHGHVKPYPERQEARPINVQVSLKKTLSSVQTLAKMVDRGCSSGQRRTLPPELQQVA